MPRSEGSIAVGLEFDLGGKLNLGRLFVMVYVDQ
jgi:hypothetical protein